MEVLPGLAIYFPVLVPWMLPMAHSGGRRVTEGRAHAQLVDVPVVDIV